MIHAIDWTFLISFAVAMGGGLTGFWLWVRERRRTARGADPVLEALSEEQAHFQAHLEERLSAFEARIDFVERSLARQGDRPPLPKPTTPV